MYLPIGKEPWPDALALHVANPYLGPFVPSCLQTLHNSVTVSIRDSQSPAHLFRHWSSDRRRPVLLSIRVSSAGVVDRPAFHPLRAPLPPRLQAAPPVPMSSLRRLHQRRPETGGASSASAASGPASANRSTGDLPPYQALECALSVDAQRALARLASSRNTKKYEEQIKKSLLHLGKTTAALNDDLRARQDELDKLQRRAEARHASREDADALANQTADLATKVSDLSGAAEKSVRLLIDRQAELQDDKTALGEISETAAQQQPQPEASQGRRRTRTRDDTPDEEEEGQEDVKMQDDQVQPPPKSLQVMLSERREAKAAEYQQLSAHRRYALNNDYVAFKKLWHDATNGEDPVPDPRRWFDENGEPVMTVRRTRVGSQASDDEDEELVITRDKRDYKCPLSLSDLRDPLTSQSCKHTFEASAIKDYMGNRPQIKCPVAGCDKVRGHFAYRRCSLMLTIR